MGYCVGVRVRRLPISACVVLVRFSDHFTFASVSIWESSYCSLASYPIIDTLLSNCRLGGFPFFPFSHSSDTSVIQKSFGGLHGYTFIPSN